MGARKKARQWTKDGETDAEEIGKVVEKIKQQAKNYREIQANTKQIQSKRNKKTKKLQGNKSKIGKSKYKQRKQPERRPGMSWPEITKRDGSGILTRHGRV
jgi:hypothetical protein